MRLLRRGIGMKGMGLALTLGVGLAGCAVLTVDVDVYKGALVNEEHVQLHQLTALATAAKPMLVNLRNALEWPYDDGMPLKGPQKCSDHDQNWYEHGYVDEPLRSMPDPSSIWIWVGRHDEPPTTAPSSAPNKKNIPCWKGFQNPMARRVNRILHLYENLGTEDLTFYAKKLLDAQAQVQEAQSILKGGQERDAERVTLIEKGFKSSLNETQGRLRDAYGTLLRLDSDGKPGSSVRLAGALMDGLQDFAMSQGKSESEIEQALITQWQRVNDYEYSTGGIYERRLPFRAVWKLLAEVDKDSTLAKATKGLFKTDAQGTEAHNVLTEWVRELVEAYWDAREATHDLWETSLRVVIQLDLLKQKEPGRQQALLDQAIDVVVRLTSLRHVASALHRVNSDEQCAFLSRALTSSMTCDSAGANPQAMWTESAVLADPDRHEVLLRRTLSQAPADTAYFLLDLDRLEKDARPSEPKDNVHNLVQAANTVSSQHVVRLGLNRSYLDGDDQDDYQRLIQELSRGLAGGFERGRLVYGLHTLVEKYLQAHDRATDKRTSRNGADQAEANHERRLLDALVEFAEKVRFLANHEGLSSPSGTPGLILGGAEKITRGLMGDWLTDHSVYRLVSGELVEDKKQRYVRVLQAVGNSILFSANELQARERHREEGEKKRDAEVMAARSVYSPGPAKVITDLLNELEHDKQVVLTTIDEASAKKKKLEDKIGSSTVPKTGLHDKEDTAQKEAAQAEQDLITYRNSLATLEALHGVLTDDVIKQVKSQWQAGGAAKNVGEFLNGAGGNSLKKALENVRQSLNGTLSQEAVKRWADAVQHVDDGKTRETFEAYRTIQGLASLEPLQLFDTFVVHIKELEAKRVKQVAQYESKYSEKQGKSARIQQEILALTEEVKDLGEQVNNTHSKSKKRLEIAKQQIGSVKAAVLMELGPDRLFISPKEVYEQINSQLQNVNTDDSRTARDILIPRLPPPGMPPLDHKDYKNPMEVMDTVIALLRHHQMEAVSRFGKDSTQAEKATEAIENAYRHRAGMIYIRPSSAYLRTSFPSTSLQDDPNLAWDNMLLKQGLRNLPFSSELRDILDPSVKQDRTLTSELDKQYWQNINRVRVSGAGGTNQALVKDDVGNWYVKQYFGDTKRIWESAKNLALFSMSAKAPTDLVKQLNKASAPEEYAENSKETPTLQKVLEKHQGAYKAHTDEILAKLERLHDKELEETLIAAWDAHANLKEDKSFNAELKQALAAEIVVWNKASTTLALKEKPGQDLGQAIVRDVGALSRLGKMLWASITKISSSDIARKEKDLETKEKELADELAAKKDASDAEREALRKKMAGVEEERKNLKDEKAKLDDKRKKAVVEVHKVVGGQVKGILDDRNRVLAEYEKAIVFIGDAAKPEETKQSN